MFLRVQDIPVPHLLRDSFNFSYIIWSCNNNKKDVDIKIFHVDADDIIHQSIAGISRITNHLIKDKLVRMCVCVCVWGGGQVYALPVAGVEIIFQALERCKH